MRFYEKVSQWKTIPVLGKFLFGAMNYLLKIPPADTGKNYSRATFQVRLLALQIKRGLCGGLTTHLKKRNGALLTSFYAPAIAADSMGIKPVFCIICDSDLNRVWVAKKPAVSKIMYFSPCREATQRLKQYGVVKDCIFTTGFPLHPEVTGTRKMELAEKNFYGRLGKLQVPFHTTRAGEKTGDKLHIAFAIGGAGAQTELAQKIFNELYDLLQDNLLKFTILAGIRQEVIQLFANNKKMMQCNNFCLAGANCYEDYFRSFNRIIGQTDILISKPSEISFFAGLGIPFIITPPIGSQEDFNRIWLLKNKAGIDLPFPVSGFSNWLIEHLDNGTFADLAKHGFRNIEKAGYYKIIDVLTYQNLIEK